MDAISGVGSQLQIGDGEIEITLNCNPDPGSTGQRGGGIPYQIYRIAIPGATVPCPNPVRPGQRGGNPPAPDRDGWYTRARAVGGMFPMIFPEDVVRGIILRDGDYRTAAYLQEIPAGFFVPHPDYFNGGHRAHSLRSGQQTRAPYFNTHLGTTSGGYVNVAYGNVPSADPRYSRSARPKISPAIQDLRSQGWEGDFDNGMSDWVDGPYLNKPDEGSDLYNASTSITDRPPYYEWRWNRADGFFSPLRQVPSAVMFGSLPTGVRRTAQAYSNNRPGDAKPWRTLNFCANPPAGGAHYGFADPPDHLLLEFFHMPVVEPYAISEPFSTAGRLNLNYRIAPFTYITRQTALYAALASQHVIAIADADAGVYKTSAIASAPDRKIRHPVDAAATLERMERYLQNHNQDVFKSASEICGVHLVPQGVGATAANIDSWWSSYRLTGNNSRERPYATLYPLLTTRSNTFTTHVRSQAIKRIPGSPAATPEFAILGEYRGSVLFERHFDPNDEDLTSGTINPDMVSLEPYFRFRTLLSKQFDP